MKRSKIVLSEVKVGDNVTIPIPSVDRGRTDLRNLIGIVTDISDNDMYTIAVKSGILNSNYSRNQFDVCATSLYTRGFQPGGRDPQGGRKGFLRGSRNE